MKRNHVWVVEIYEDDENWAPTTCVEFTTRKAIMEMRALRETNPDELFRLRKYTAEQSGGD